MKKIGSMTLCGCNLCTQVAKAINQVGTPGGDMTMRVSIHNRTEDVRSQRDWNWTEEAEDIAKD